jgi:FtsZ-binding cell division protein ZapB
MKRSLIIFAGLALSIITIEQTDAGNGRCRIRAVQSSCHPVCQPICQVVPSGVIEPQATDCCASAVQPVGEQVVSHGMSLPLPEPISSVDNVDQSQSVADVPLPVATENSEESNAVVSATNNDEELAALRAEIESLKQANAAKDAELEKSRALVSSREESKAQAEMFAKQAQEAAAAKEELAKANAALNEQQAATNAKLAELNGQMETLNADLKKARQSNKGLRKQNEQLKADLSKANEAAPEPTEPREPEENAAPAPAVKEEAAEGAEGEPAAEEGTDGVDA